MTPCSRCGCTEPNIECYVCWTPPAEEPDAFLEDKKYEDFPYFTNLFNPYEDLCII